ncbi:MAG: ankyrin repeat domain-containing protein, partial [Rickettsiaceae bacterium]|nr:ankyrin repeat domain-containing protein [Rickettsiaceae bacterium]
MAIANEKFDDVKKLIDANEGYVKGRDFYGNTPLHFAVQAKNLEILQFLMDYIEKQNQKEGYFVDKNCDGCTPLHFAAGSGNVEFFSKLLKFVGAEAKEGYVQSKNNKGETPLHFAARSGKAEVVSKLLEFALLCRAVVAASSCWKECFIIASGWIRSTPTRHPQA